MLLASLMANGDAGDAITVRIMAAAGYGDGHAATRRAVTRRRSHGAHFVLSLPWEVRVGVLSLLRVLHSPLPGTLLLLLSFSVPLWVPWFPVPNSKR